MNANSKVAEMDLKDVVKTVEIQIKMNQLFVESGIHFQYNEEGRMVRV